MAAIRTDAVITMRKGGEKRVTALPWRKDKEMRNIMSVAVLNRKLPGHSDSLWVSVIIGFQLERQRVANVNVLREVSILV